MISKESCDTEDWSNDAAIIGIIYILKYIKLNKFLCFFYSYSQPL